MPPIVLTDSCFWIGLVDPADQYHEDSVQIFELFLSTKGYKIVFPWPCLYETISTRLVRRREQTFKFENWIKELEIELFDDSMYKKGALKEVFNSLRSYGYTFSLTDGVIREVLKDINVKIDYMITFNRRDFSDICAKRQIRIFPD
ncbi:MAG: hypothetical protein M1428_02945 [Deltaproteobacteria bacterium]|nr:hypothetical protein [Deltaproteobacteria bacterium]